MVIDVRDELRGYGRFLDEQIRDPEPEPMAAFVWESTTPRRRGGTAWGLATHARRPTNQLAAHRTAGLALLVPALAVLVVAGTWLLGSSPSGQAPAGQPSEPPPTTASNPLASMGTLVWNEPLRAGEGYDAMVDGFPTLGMAGELYVAYGLGSGRDRYSVDGVDWSAPAPRGLGAYDLHRIEGRFALGGRGGDVVLLHDDGSRWVPLGVVAQDDWGFERTLRVVDDKAFVYNYGEGVWVSDGLSLGLRDDVSWPPTSTQDSPSVLPPTDGEHIGAYAFDLGYVGYALDREKVQSADLDGDSFEQGCPDCIETWLSSDGTTWEASTPVPDPGFSADESPGAVGDLVFHGFFGKARDEVDWRGVLHIGRFIP